MYKRPFLTIGIANYNYSQYLIKAFEQIKRQKFIDFELLYCDDGSTDDSLKIIYKLIDENQSINIRVIEGEHEGILANRNRILDNAMGKYLLICDSDDYMENNCLERLCCLAQKEDADCIIGGFEEINDSGKSLKKHVPKLDANKWLFTWHHAQIYKLDLVKNNHIRFTDLPDDVCYLQQIHLHSKKILFVSEVLYKWLRHYGSASADIDKNSEWNPKYIWKNLSEFISRLRGSVEENEDILALNYYLYKWYYFNISDIHICGNGEFVEDLKNMRLCMKKASPDYRKITFFFKTLRIRDTCFAKCAIIFCWMLEGIGGVKGISWLRRMQYKIR